MEKILNKQLNKIRSQFLDDWDIPNFYINFFCAKKSKYCVVIPVINEGQRINIFVKRLKENNIDKFADILIIDGGSTDNSLDEEVLQDFGVNCLLTKNDKGKLSSQLRIAYAFALINGYEGVITIDGNNKDDPSTIKEFILLLQKGYDFIQASRFIKGGSHRNTPLIRYLAIRFIHAPLLSFFAGFWWTDTTQGFRAYSKNCLLDNRIKPFRKIFLDYELLSYLSYRVPNIGFKCIEYPSVRIYPKGKIPTKISSFKGNLQLMKTLILTCLGNYNPK